MLHIISKLFWRRSPEHEEYLEGFEGIVESEGERKKMSSAQLAIRPSECERDSPAYILFEHELNRRIAHVQALPAYLSPIMTIVGIFVGWGLAQWKPFELKTSLDIVAEHIKKHDTAHSSNLRNAKINATVQPETTSGFDRTVVTSKPESQEKAKYKNHNGDSTEPKCRH